MHLARFSAHLVRSAPSRTAIQRMWRAAERQARERLGHEPALPAAGRPGHRDKGWALRLATQHGQVVGAVDEPGAIPGGLRQVERAPGRPEGGVADQGEQPRRAGVPPATRRPDTETLRPSGPVTLTVTSERCCVSQTGQRPGQHGRDRRGGRGGRDHELHGRAHGTGRRPPRGRDPPAQRRLVPQPVPQRLHVGSRAVHLDPRLHAQPPGAPAARFDVRPGADHKPRRSGGGLCAFSA
jgi:hypothetical protein